MKKITTYLLLILAVSVGCSRDDSDIRRDDPSNNSRNRSYSKDYTVHQFVWETMYTYYYWNDKIPNRLNITQFNTPNDVFEYFLYPEDRFSAIMNNYTETESYFNNVYVTDGINFILGPDRLNSDNVVAYVQYVYKDSPGEAAGIKRGDVITKVNGQTLNKTNYKSLLSLDSYTLTYSKLSVPNGMWEAREYYDTEYTSPLITKISMDIDPVLQVSTHEIDGHKIGYFLYDSFDDGTETLTQAIEKLADQHITELVLDLRLNGGGYITTLNKLASMIIPSGYENKLFIQTDVNPILEKQFKEDNEELNLYFSEQNTHLNINKLYVITSNQTASASEELISGLSPYMDVVIIGTPTYGKYTTNLLLNDNYDKGTDSDGINYSEWALYLVVGVCKNSAGEMNFKDGFTPNYLLPDYFESSLGNVEEPLFAKAISLIISNQAPIAKRAKISVNNDYSFIGASEKPIYKQNLTINRPIIRQ